MNRFAFVMGLGVVACGGGTTGPAAEPAAAAPVEAAPPAEAAAPASSTMAPATFEDQVALGQQLYGANCASCHGASGEGGKAPRVVGLKEGALPLDPPAGAKYRKEQFKTVGDVAKFVVATMPPNKAGSLTTDEYLAILAFDLKANGITLPNKLDLPTADTLQIPR
jgi:mono/diheme cytochrome c family protein